MVPLLLITLWSCSSTAKSFNPGKKFSPVQLQQDFSLFRQVLEQKHPGLYWYSTKYQVESAFEAGSRLLKDSMTESGFRKIL